jgi:hypothetical protein
MQAAKKQAGLTRKRSMICGALSPTSKKSGNVSNWNNREAFSLNLSALRSPQFSLIFLVPADFSWLLDFLISSTKRSSTIRSTQKKRPAFPAERFCVAQRMR